MIDTVCLLVPKNKMRYVEGVSSWELYSKTEEYKKYVRNPSKAEKESGKYFPRLTGYQRRFTQDANVRIEFSAPKLLYGNNLSELEDKDFPAVVTELQKRLSTMGVIVNRSELVNASVCSVHYSKNIVLENGYTATYIISELNKVNVRKNADHTKTRFMNDGESLYQHSTSHQYVIYDKIADLRKGPKRAIDKAQGPLQRSLFSQYDISLQKQEILRIEIRLSQKQKLNSVLEGLGYSKNPTFKDVFSVEKSKKIVAQYWQSLTVKASLGVFGLSVSGKEALVRIYLSDKNMKPKQAIYLAGLYVLAKDDAGIRQLRSLVSKNSEDRTWYRIKEDIKLVNGYVSKHTVRDWVHQISKKLEEFEAYKVLH